MTLRYLLDTNICVYLINNRPGQLADTFNERFSEIAISSITLAELLFGAEKSQRQQQNLLAIETFAGRSRVLDFGWNAARHYGQIRADLERIGKPIGSEDLLIAAHARSEGLIVVTNNRREFDRVPGLRVENWL